jgi:hypothetical protein
MKPDQLIAYAVKSLLDGIPPVFGPAENWFDVIAVEDLAMGLYLGRPVIVRQLVPVHYRHGPALPARVPLSREVRVYNRAQVLAAVAVRVPQEKNI